MAMNLDLASKYDVPTKPKQLCDFIEKRSGAWPSMETPKEQRAKCIPALASEGFTFSTPRVSSNATEQSNSQFHSSTKQVPSDETENVASQSHLSRMGRQGSLANCGHTSNECSDQNILSKSINSELNKEKAMESRGTAVDLRLLPPNSYLKQTPTKSHGNSNNLNLSSLERMHRNLSFAWQYAYDVSPISEIKLETLRLADPELPHVFIVKCIDYSNKYGIGYQLTNGVTGVSFNDSTVLVVAPDAYHFEYLYQCRIYPSSITPGRTLGSPGQSSSNVMKRQSHTMNQYPPDLVKKVTLLGHFRDYMDQNMLRLPYMYSDVSKTSELEFVTRYYRHSSGGIYRLSNHVVQINFHDHTKILLSQDACIITYIDRTRTVRHYQLADLLKIRNQAASLNLSMSATMNSTMPNMQFRTSSAKDTTLSEELLGRLQLAKDMVEWVLQKRKRATSSTSGQT
jgi:hypothetical protein